MTRRVSESGFTLLEVLVASILLGMLVTILTMVFNSSSIAWRTGKASVAEMDDVRKGISGAGLAVDNAIPRVDAQNPQEWGCIVGPWKTDGTMRKRGIEKMASSKIASDVWSSLTLDSKVKSPNKDVGPGKWSRSTGIQLWAELAPGRIGLGRNVSSFAVGVMSQGPDIVKTTDDISTWPDTK